MYHKEGIEGNHGITPCKDIAQPQSNQAAFGDMVAGDILEAIPDIMFQVKRSGIISGFKPSQQYPFLQSSATVIGQHIRTMVPAQAEESLVKGIALTLDTGEMQLFEYEWTNAEKFKYFEFRVTKVCEETVLIIARDISERWQSEACDLAILDIGIKVQEEGAIDEIINFACDRIREIFRVPLLWVGLKKPDAGVKLFISFTNSEESLQSVLLRWDASPEGSGPTGTAIRTGKFQLMNILDPRLILWRETLQNYFITSGAAFPLKASGFILGALTVYTENMDFWTKRTIVHLTNFSKQIALAIHMIENRQRLKLLTTGLESAANAIVITNRNGTIEWINPAFLKLNGYGAAEVEAANVQLLQSRQHTRAFYKAIHQYIATGRIWHGELTNCRKDGSVYISETTITPVRDEGGKIINFIAMIQDITQRKQVEVEMAEAREAMARAERLNALGTMAGGIAHEINQPLNSLKVFADGMLYWYKQGKVPDMGEVMENIQEISKQASRIDDIIKHMRAFICGNHLDHLTPCSVNQAVEQSLLLIGSQLATHDITVEIQLGANLPMIIGNCTQLEQIIINLLVNAMQSLDTVKKDNKEIIIVTGSQGNQVFLNISDNGAGISKELQNKIFDPFVTTKFAGEGMGLGLSIVHAIVISYGGRIKVQDDQSSGGISFLIEFPAVAVRAKKGEELL